MSPAWRTSARVLLCLVAAFWCVAPRTGTGQEASLDEEVQRSRAGTQELDEIIGVAFKLLAKRFIASRGLHDVQNSVLDKLRDLSEDDFSLIYAQVYDVIGSMPEEKRLRYHINRDMFKFQAIEFVAGLNDQSAGEFIDAIANRAIAVKFRQMAGERIDDDSDQRIADRINRAWKQITVVLQ